MLIEKYKIFSFWQMLYNMHVEVVIVDQWVILTCQL